MSFNAGTRNFTINSPTDLTLTTISSPYYVDYSIEVRVWVSSETPVSEFFNLKIYNPCTIRTLQPSVAEVIQTPTSPMVERVYSVNTDFITIPIMPYYSVSNSLCGSIQLTTSVDDSTWPVKWIAADNQF